MALADVYQLNVCQVINGRETSNVFYYVESKVTTLTPGQVGLELCERFYVRVWDSHWRLRVVTNVELTCIWCRRIWPTSEDAQVLPFASSIGTVPGDSIPNGSCALLSFASLTPSRNFSRRTYLSGITETWILNSQLTAAARTDLRSLASQIEEQELVPLTDLTSEYLPAAYSKKLAAAADPQPWRLLANSWVHRNVRSQRRRNLSGGA